MSWSIYITCFHKGELGRFPREILDRAFEPFCSRNEDLSGLSTTAAARSMSSSSGRSTAFPSIGRRGPIIRSGRRSSRC